MFAITTGNDDIANPYTIQDPTPQINIIKVTKETSSAFLVFIVLISWGKNAAVVRIAAKYPKNSIYKEFIIYISQIKKLMDPPFLKNNLGHNWKNTYK